MTIQAVRHQGGVRLMLQGRLDFNSRHVFRNTVETRREPLLWLDFREVTYINGCGLGLLLLLAKECALHRRKIFIVNATGTVADILRLANLHKVIPVSEVSAGSDTTESLSPDDRPLAA